MALSRAYLANLRVLDKIKNDTVCLKRAEKMVGASCGDSALVSFWDLWNSPGIKQVVFFDACALSSATRVGLYMTYGFLHDQVYVDDDQGHRSGASAADIVSRLAAAKF